MEAHESPTKPEVKVITYFHIRKIIGQKQLTLKANTVRGMLEELITSLQPEIREELSKVLFKNEEVSPKYRIMVNGRSISLLEGLNTRLKEGDEIALIPAVGGGISC